MAIKVGINGFGRIGRVVLRIMIEHPEQFDICGINLRKADLDYMVYMIKYDSVFRQFNGTVEHKDKNLIVHGHTIQGVRRGDDPLVQLRRGVHHRVHRRLQHHREGLPPLQGRREEGHPDRARQG